VYDVRQEDSIVANDLTRRHFIGGAVAVAAGTNAASGAAKSALPTRVLGRTGAKPSILALGCGSRLLSYKEEDKAVEAINLALDSGVTYVDTAQSYGNGRSETWVGKVMKHRREGIFLATKIQLRGADEAMKRFEESLRLLNTDHVDLCHIHALDDEADLAAIEAKGGVLETMYKIRDQKMARFIGVTCHHDPVILAKALERHDFDCTQMALNAALQGMQNGQGKMVLNPAMRTGFETIALPAAKKKNIGVIAMKVFGQEDLVGGKNGQATVEKLLQYALSLPVAVAVAGMPQLDFIRENTTLARNFKPMPKNEMKKFSDEMATAYKAALDRKFAHHIDT
jgi:predicted aldo/keto reductase-like oxidoreductase